jgi:hypothetical protein
MITHKAKEGDLRKALQEINKLSVVRAKSKFIRILDQNLLKLNIKEKTNVLSGHNKAI